MNIPNSLRKLVAACAVSAAAHAGAVPVLLVNSDGILTGANNVDVAGALYNVTFTDGSCNSLFNNCNDASFAFHTPEDALRAANALLEQVFVDGPSGQFDSDPWKISGCEDVLIVGGDSIQCASLIPYGVLAGDALLSVSRNYATNVNIADGSSFGTFPSDVDTSRPGIINYSIFQLVSPPPADVPEPSSIALMALAIAGLAFAHRHKV